MLLRKIIKLLSFDPTFLIVISCFLVVLTNHSVCIIFQNNCLGCVLVFVFVFKAVGNFKLNLKWCWMSPNTVCNLSENAVMVKDQEAFLRHLSLPLGGARVLWAWSGKRGSQLVVSGLTIFPYHEVSTQIYSTKTRENTFYHVW